MSDAVPLVVVSFAQGRVPRAKGSGDPGVPITVLTMNRIAGRQA